MPSAEGLTWEGASVIELIGTVHELFPQVPLFSRHPFRVGGEENRFKDEIRREPLMIHEEPFPIATVSKTYSLVQHRDLLSSIFRALKLIKHDISGQSCSLLLSEYGERMYWSCAIPGADFDPGDQYPLVLLITCLNSVDTTTALEIAFSWCRLVCGNGLMLSLRDSRMYKRHIQSLDPQDIAENLAAQLEQVPSERGLFETWRRTPVNLLSLVGWIDGPLSGKWGAHAGRRTWQILMNGCDCVVEQARGVQPHHLPIGNTTPVPGSCAPVNNVYHVSQALSWIAGTRNTIPERLRYLIEIPDLIRQIG